MSLVECNSKAKTMTRTPLIPLFLTEDQTAERLGISKRTLQKKRLEGGGIPYHKMWGCVRYAVADIERFEAETRRASTSDTGPAEPRLCNTHTQHMESVEAYCHHPLKRLNEHLSRPSSGEGFSK